MQYFNASSLFRGGMDGICLLSSSPVPFLRPLNNRQSSIRSADIFKATFLFVSPILDGYFFIQQMFLTTVFEDCLRHAIKDTSERRRARVSLGLSLSRQIFRWIFVNGNQPFHWNKRNIEFKWSSSSIDDIGWSTTTKWRQKSNPLKSDGWSFTVTPTYLASNLLTMDMPILFR